MVPDHGGDKDILDFAHLARFTVADRGVEAEILATFRLGAQDYLKRLRAALDGDDWEDIAHGLKGAAQGVGARELARLAARAEALEDGAADRRRQMLGDLEAALSRVEARIERRLCEPDGEAGTGRRGGP